MLKKDTISFLGKLAKNNNKAWFDEHRDDYMAAKEDHEALVKDILGKIAVAEPVFKEQQPKDCIFRIFRDVRFSKDKTPYKAHFGAFFSKGGRKFPGAGYYLHVEPGGKSFAGGGLWMPESPLLKGVRQEIDYNFNEFRKIVEDRKFKKLFPELSGEELKTLPQGYAADNPAIAYLKMKSITVIHNMPDADLTNEKFTKNVAEIFKTMKPFIDFLNRPLE